MLRNSVDLQKFWFRNRYKSREEFCSDVRLIFNNCETFNEDDSPVGKAGHGMRTFFEARWGEINGHKQGPQPQSTLSPTHWRWKDLSVAWHARSAAHEVRLVLKQMWYIGWRLAFLPRNVKCQLGGTDWCTSTNNFTDLGKSYQTLFTTDVFRENYAIWMNK